MIKILFIVTIMVATDVINGLQYNCDCNMNLIFCFQSSIMDVMISLWIY